ncbi:MAG: hypothetical protein WKF36_09095 [Candidatus Nitrosocosmicus sp.]
MKKRSMETLILISVIVVIPGFVYFTSPLNKIVCAHMFSTDDATSLVGMMEEYGVQLNSIKNNIDANSTLSRLQVDNILNQSYASRIANQIYTTESIGNGDLTKSLNDLKGLFSSTAETDNEHYKEANAIKTETNNINSLLDSCKKLFIDSDLTNNNAFNALVAENLLDSALRYYESGMKEDPNGKGVSAKNSVYYQNALGFANRSNQLLNQMAKSQFQNNATIMSIFSLTGGFYHFWRTYGR